MCCGYIQQIFYSFFNQNVLFSNYQVATLYSYFIHQLNPCTPLFSSTAPVIVIFVPVQEVYVRNCVCLNEQLEREAIEEKEEGGWGWFRAWQPELAAASRSDNL